MTQERTVTKPLDPSITLAADAAEMAVRARSRYALMYKVPKSTASADSEYALASDAVVRAAAARMRIVAQTPSAVPGARQRGLARAAGIYRRAMRTLFEGQPGKPLGTLGA